MSPQSGYLPAATAGFYNLSSFQVGWMAFQTRPDYGATPIQVPSCQIRSAHHDNTINKTSPHEKKKKSLEAIVVFVRKRKV